MESFVTRLNTFIDGCTEDYLIRYANKGLYNRANKDIDKGITVQYTWTEQEAVQCILSDEHIVQLTDNIERCTCNCPAEQLCKHILIAILYEQRHHLIGAGAGKLSDASHLEGEDEQNEATIDIANDKASAHQSDTNDPSERANPANPANPASVSNGFAWMTDKPLSELLSGFTHAQLEEVDFRLGLQESIKVTHDTLLTVRLERTGVDVSFQRDKADPAAALCSVKTKDAPIYRLEALLRYRQQHGIDDQLSLEKHMYTFSAHPRVLEEAQQLFREMLLTGLARLPETVTARLETLAITARSEGMPNLELLLRGIQGELELFFARHVRFQIGVLRTRLMEAYLSLEAWQQEIGAAQRARLAGSFRSKYYTVAQLDLYGIGAEPWETRSGYRGITCYLYCPTERRIYTYTDTRPVYYESTTFNYEKQYQQSVAWRHALSLQRFIRGQWSFRIVKINRDHRLSTGEVGALEEQPRQSVEALDFASYELGADADSMVSATRTLAIQPSLFGENNRQLLILAIARVESIQFDRLSQTTQINVITEAGELLAFTLLDHPEWRQQLQRVERSEAIRKLEHFRALVQTDGRQFYPISFLQEDRMLNLLLDQL